MPAPTIDELVLADEPERWRALGFAVSGDGCRLELGIPRPLQAKGEGGE